MKIKRAISIDEKLVEIIEREFPESKFSRVVNAALIQYLTDNNLLSDKDRLDMATK